MLTISVFRPIIWLTLPLLFCTNKSICSDISRTSFSNCNISSNYTMQHIIHVHMYDKRVCVSVCLTFSAFSAIMYDLQFKFKQSSQLN